MKTFPTEDADKIIHLDHEKKNLQRRSERNLKNTRKKIAKYWPQILENWNFKIIHVNQPNNRPTSNNFNKKKNCIKNVDQTSPSPPDPRQQILYSTETSRKNIRKKN